MKLYVTNHSFDKIKQSFLNLRLYYFVNVDQILESHGYTRDTLDSTSSFIINDYIKEKVTLATRSKRYRDIVYVNSQLDLGVIENLKTFIEDIPKINDLILIDEDDLKPNEMQKHFKEILYFPTGKKVRIYECKPIQSKMFYWVNNLPFPEELENTQESISI